MRWQALKNFMRTAGALCAAGIVLLCVWCLRATRFAGIEGDRSFYLYSASSQAQIKDSLSLRDLFHLEGESVSFALEEGGIEGLLSRFRATIVWEERVGETTSYYCYSPKWSEGVLIEKGFVNLHIAVSKDRCAVGYPIIFGGF